MFDSIDLVLIYIIFCMLEQKTLIIRGKNQGQGHHRDYFRRMNDLPEQKKINRAKPICFCLNAMRLKELFVECLKINDI